MVMKFVLMFWYFCKVILRQSPKTKCFAFATLKGFAQGKVDQVTEYCIVYTGTLLLPLSSRCQWTNLLSQLCVGKFKTGQNCLHLLKSKKYVQTG